MPTNDESVEYTRLDSMADVSGGITLGGISPDGASVKLPYLRVANVQDGYISTADLKIISVSARLVERFRLRCGDVVLTEGGDADKLGRGAVWDGRIDPCLHQNHVFRVRCLENKLLPGFLALYMGSPEGKAYFLRIAKQTTNLASISLSQLKAMPVPSPPISEQQRVLEIVDAVSNQESAIKASIAKLEVVQTGITAELLAVERDSLMEIPVREVGTVRMGKQLSPSSREATGQFPYLRVANVLNGRIDYSDVKTMGFSESERETYGLRPGDILLNEGQSLELVGRSAIYDGNEGAFCFQNTLIRFRPSEQVLPAYAQVIFERWLSDGVFAAVAKKTTSIAHLGGERFAALNFPLVPLAKQRRIIEGVDAFAQQRRSLEHELAKLGRLKQGMVDDLLSGRVSV
ncbi:restriction endonuclease subunit S [Microbispora sp. NPDC049633]|uniref:restriction endonuclease subunit S n=1 Tax=Microbispora sp. NPDC049633 TaxID=3154355 RepID=UPI00342D9FE6